jgi:hypothetical protein
VLNNWKEKTMGIEQDFPHKCEIVQKAKAEIDKCRNIAQLRRLIDRVKHVEAYAEAKRQELNF